MLSLSLWERSHKRYGDRRELSERGEGVVTNLEREIMDRLHDLVSLARPSRGSGEVPIVDLF